MRLFQRLALNKNRLVIKSATVTARSIHQNDEAWRNLYSLFNSIAGARQIFDLTIDLVQTSCGMAVPFYDFIEPREQLTNWAEKQGEKGLKDYWQTRNQLSLDGKKTHIVDKNTCKSLC